MAVIPAGIGLNWYERNSRKMHSETWQSGAIHTFTGPQVILYDDHEEYVDVGLLTFTYYLPFMQSKCQIGESISIYFAGI